MISRDVVLKENNKFMSNKPTEGIGVVPSRNKENVTEIEMEYGSQIDIETRAPQVVSDQLSDYQLTRDKERRPRRRPTRYKDGDDSMYSVQGEGIDLIAFTINVASNVCKMKPQSYKEAMNIHKTQKWKESMK